jgi:hypothetical protein
MTDDASANRTTDFRRFLNEAEHTASRDYDRLITTLASGALGLSIVFVHDIAPHPTHLPWLVSAWLCFAASLLSTLVSYLTGLKGIRVMIVDIAAGKKPQRSFSSRVTVFLNRSALVLFGLGVVMFIFFAAFNLRQEKLNGGNRKNQTEAGGTRGQSEPRRTGTGTGTSAGTGRT